LAAQGGANLIYGAGMLEMGMTFDLAQLLLDAEIYKMVLHTINGFDVNEGTLALDVIKEIKTGEFVSHKHTLKNFKSVQSHSDLIDRRNRGAWIKSGSKDITELAYEKAVNILKNHKPEALDPKSAAIIRKIVEDSETEYGVKTSGMV